MRYYPSFLFGKRLCKVQSPVKQRETFVLSSICSFIRLFVCPFICLSVCPFIHWSICPFVCSSIYTLSSLKSVLSGHITTLSDHKSAHPGHKSVSLCFKSALKGLTLGHSGLIVILYVIIIVIILYQPSEASYQLKGLNQNCLAINQISLSLQSHSFKADQRVSLTTYCLLATGSCITISLDSVLVPNALHLCLHCSICRTLHSILSLPVFSVSVPISKFLRASQPSFYISSS